MGKRVRFLLFIFIIFFFYLPPALAADYYISPTGNDGASGTVQTPWKTMSQSVKKLHAGDTLFVREGTYPTVDGGWVFSYSGTSSQPIKITNYPNEQAIFSIQNEAETFSAFRCWDNPLWQTVHADYIKIMGTDVSPKTLANGVQSVKGIVIQGPSLTQGKHTLAPGISPNNCDFWEIAGVDFVDVGSAIFAHKMNNHPSTDPLQHSTTNWNIHHNRVHGFYAESGIQLDGDLNTVSNNEIRKVHNQHFTEFGCQMLNILGYGNTITQNYLGLGGSTDECWGLLLEWDLADKNIVERNQIWDTDVGLMIFGGDNNIIRNNLIIMSKPTVPQYSRGINLDSSDSPTTISTHTHCWTEKTRHIPPQNTSYPTYYHYWEPRNCRSYGNQIYNNTVYRYPASIYFWEFVPNDTIIRNNAFSNWTRGAICDYIKASGQCRPLPTTLIQTNNKESGDFGFVNAATYDFKLRSDPGLINAGFNLNSLVPNDYEGNSRPQDGSYDIGAFELTPVVKSPQCSLNTYADNAANSPPSYILSTNINTVSPNQQFVIATNIFNNTGKNYDTASNHLTLGRYLEFVDSNGTNCSYDDRAKIVKCVHGYFGSGGATSMAFRVKYKGQTVAPISIFGTTFTSSGDTGSCMTSLNDIPLLP